MRKTKESPVKLVLKTAENSYSRLLSISLSKETEQIIHHILYETAELCLGHISREVRDKYCEAEKLLILPNELSEPIRKRAVHLYAQKTLVVSRKLKAVYGEPEKRVSHP